MYNELVDMQFKATLTERNFDHSGIRSENLNFAMKKESITNDSKWFLRTREYKNLWYFESLSHEEH